MLTKECQDYDYTEQEASKSPNVRYMGISKIQAADKMGVEWRTSTTILTTKHLASKKRDFSTRSGPILEPGQSGTSKSNIHSHLRISNVQIEKTCEPVELDVYVSCTPTNGPNTRNYANADATAFDPHVADMLAISTRGLLRG